MSEKLIVLVEDFHPRPYGRYITDCKTCDQTAGEVFRDKHLVEALEKNDHVTVDLTGYNRYGRSFLDEAFAGLISERNFTKDELDKKLTYTHDDLTSVIAIIDERIAHAESVRLKK